jgi:hypothetical protein
MQPIEKELVSHAKTQALLDWKFKNGGTSGGLNKQRFNQVDYKLVTNSLNIRKNNLRKPISH